MSIIGGNTVQTAQVPLGISSEVQSIGFYKRPIGVWTRELADKWLEDNSYNPIKDGHETANMIHYRINEPSPNVYSKFISKQIGKGKKKILITVGVGKKCSRLGGGCCRCSTSDQNSYGYGGTTYVSNNSFEADGKSILKSIVPEDEYHLEPDIGLQSKDLRSDVVKENEAKSLTNTLIPNFGPDTMIGAMLKPVKEGGIGFPFPVSMSTFSPSAYR